jgi:hypothetical protein
MLECYWKSNFGVICPGCGFQRSFIELFKGNFLESLDLFPATIPILLTFLLAAFHLIFKFKHGAYTIVGLFSFSVVLMMGKFIIETIHNH